MATIFFVLYNIVILLGVLVAIPALLIVRPSYLKHLQERLGRLPGVPGAVWVHAASVGEVKASVPLLKRIRSLGHRVVLTTNTSAARELGSGLGIEGVSVSYAPLDGIAFTLYAMHRVSPKALIIMETELWPDMLLSAHIAGVSVASVNARLTPKGLKGYLHIRRVVRPLLARFRLVCVQTEEDGERFVRLGARRETVHVTGNIKYAIACEDAATSSGDLRRLFPGRPVVIAGSTHTGEEKIIIDCFTAIKQAADRPLLIIAPRHLARTGEVEAIIQQAGLRCIKRSSITEQTAASEIDVVLLDTIGELAGLYGIGDAIFVGGSMVPVGGHNLLEVVVHKKPVIYGRHTESIKDIVALLDGNGGIEVGDGASLCAAIEDLLAHPEKARALGLKAFDIIKNKVGTLDSTVKIMRDAGVL